MSIKHRINNLLQDSFLRNVFTVFSGTSISQAIPILITPILTRLYPEEIFGVFFLYSSSVMVLTIISTLRYELATVLPQNEKDGFNMMVFSLLIVLIMGTIMFFLLFVFSDRFVELLNNQGIKKWLPFLPVSVVLVGSFKVLSYWNNRNKNFKAVAYGKVTKSSTGGVFQLLFGGMGFKNYGLISGLIVGQLGSAIFILYKTWKKYKALINCLSFKRMLYLAKYYKDIPIFNTLISLLNNLSNHIPIFLLTRFYGVSTASYYGLANRVIRTPMGVIQQSVSEVFYQEASRLFNSRKELYQFVKRMYIRLFKLAIVPSVIIMIFAPVLFKFIFGSNWTLAGTFSQIMIPWLFIGFMNSSVSTIITVINKQRSLLFYNILLLIARISGLYLGFYFFENAVYSVIFFTGAGFIFNIFLFFYLLHLSKNVYYKY